MGHTHAAERRLFVTLSHLLQYRPTPLLPLPSPASPPPFRSICSAQHADDVRLPDEDVVSVPRSVGHTPHVSSKEQYEEMYRQSIMNPDAFWSSLAKGLYWKRLWDKEQPVCNFNFDRRKGPIFVEWFRGGYTNMCYNALDHHVLSGRGNQTAILWEGNDIGEDSCLTYNDLLNHTCQLANFLRSRNVGKGDTVCIYMPMIPELPIAMLACARIGAIHSVVFGGFSAESLAGRMLDCSPKVLLTCSAYRRANKLITLKSIVDQAIQLCIDRENFTPDLCLVYDNNRAVSRENVPWKKGRDLWWQDTIIHMGTYSPVEWLEAEEPLFMLYTSGSTGKPKGVLHTVGGYMVYAAVTFKYGFDYKQEDVFWCTADCGWITGHTYVTYGPLLNCATCVMFEGVPTWPDAGRCWQIVDKLKVTIFHTAPTAIRTMEASGDEYVKRYSRTTLRLLGSVGEPINAKAWHWYYNIVGEKRCPIMDTWWQTETGGTMISPLPWAWPLKPGSATLPFFGVLPVLLDGNGREQQGPCEGYLCIKKPWPGIARTLYKNHERFEESYFSIWMGYYATGDGCRRDDDGYYWITGRVDDVINVSGHRISTGEVESALESHPSCAEAAVVGIDHGVKGQGIYALVVLIDGFKPSEDLRRSYMDSVRKQIGAFAVPEIIHWTPGLPKTRSGKIMRRILRKIAANQMNDLGDLSSLSDPSIVVAIVKSRPN